MYPVECIDNGAGYFAASLTIGKKYPAIPDSSAPADWIRVIDESGEDYLYPSRYFVALDEKALADYYFDNRDDPDMWEQVPEDIDIPKRGSGAILGSHFSFTSDSSERYKQAVRDVMEHHFEKGDLVEVIFRYRA